MSYNEPMEPNGSTTETEEKAPPSMISQVLAQISDHLELISLESRYESGRAMRWLAFVGASLFIAFFAFALLQVTFVGLLMKMGLSLGLSCLTLAVVYGLVAAGLGWTVMRSNRGAGMPFEASQREIKETLKWIQKLLS
jgi:uncharacterized membrane protein YqjE